MFKQHLEFPVLLTDHNNYFVKLPPNCQIKDLPVVLKIIRLYYYENDGNCTFLSFL